MPCGKTHFENVSVCLVPLFGAVMALLGFLGICSVQDMQGRRTARLNAAHAAGLGRNVWTLAAMTCVANWSSKLILAGIASARLLDCCYYAPIDCDQMLDRRDEEAFDTAWNPQEIAAIWDAHDERESMDELIDQIRREAFLAVSRASNQHDISGYVSDDFELIAHARVLGVVHPFVDCL